MGEDDDSEHNLQLDESSVREGDARQQPVVYFCGLEEANELCPAERKHYAGDGLEMGSWFTRNGVSRASLSKTAANNNKSSVQSHGQY